MRTSRASSSSLTAKWLLFTQLSLLKDLVIRCVRQFIRRAKSMLLRRQNVVVEPAAEISVVDVKSRDLVAEVRIHDYVCIEIPILEETPLLGSVKTYSATATTEFVPKISSGSYADKGEHREYMEDEHICIDDLSSHLGSSVFKFPVPVSFYGVFDGHSGHKASQYIKENATRLFFKDSVFRDSHSIVDTFLLQEVERSHRRAYKQADLEMEDERIVSDASGTTSLTALVIGRHLMVANVGDCRAVLSRNGTAVDMSSDHRYASEAERRRVMGLGGNFVDEYLHGELAVTRALGDWSLKKREEEPLLSLISDPEIKQMDLTEEDEFLIMGCDGVWDVMTSHYAVSFARQRLKSHGDPRSRPGPGHRRRNPPLRASQFCTTILDVNGALEKKNMKNKGINLCFRVGHYKFF